MKEPTVLLHTDVAGQLWEFSAHSSKSKARKSLGDTLEHKLLITERNARDIQKKERKSLQLIDFHLRLRNRICLERVLVSCAFPFLTQLEKMSQRATKM